MANCRQCSVAFIIVLFALNSSKGIDLDLSNIARFSYIPFICFFIMSGLIIGRLLGLFYRVRLRNIYRVHAGRRYILSRSGLRSRCVRLRFRHIKGGCRI